MPDERGAPKNEHAVELGRMGGKKGGLARAQKLSKEQRSAIAQRAAASRWHEAPQDSLVPHAEGTDDEPGNRSELLDEADFSAAHQGADLDELPLAAYGSADRPLKIGNIEIPCYVLSDGRRVLVQRDAPDHDD